MATKKRKAVAPPGVKDPELYELRRRQLIDVATRLFSAKGYAQTTMRDIAQAAGVSVGLPYIYFRSKENIFAQATRLFTDHLKTLLERDIVTHADPLSRLTKAFRSYVRIVDEASDLHLLVYREMPVLERSTRRYITEQELEMVNWFQEILEDGIRQGIFRPHQTRLRAHTIIFTAHMWALKRWALRTVMMPDDFAKEQMDVVINGILANRQLSTQEKLGSEENL